MSLHCSWPWSITWLLRRMEITEADLLLCENEAIHVPGLIQSHGFLLALNSETLTVETVSENAGEYLQTGAPGLLSKTLPEIFDLSSSRFLLNLISEGIRQDDFSRLDPPPLQIGELFFEVVLH